MSRRLMLRDESAEESIPIGVNLFSVDMILARDSCWDSRTVINTQNINYRSASGFRRFVLPFDSSMTFSQTGLSASGTIVRTILVDENGYARYMANYLTDPTAIKNKALALEAENDYRITQIYANSTTDNVTWIRTG